MRQPAKAVACFRVVVEALEEFGELFRTIDFRPTHGARADDFPAAGIDEIEAEQFCILIHRRPRQQLQPIGFNLGCIERNAEIE